MDLNNYREDPNDLLKAKEAAGRFKDKNDIEQLKKKNKPD